MRKLIVGLGNPGPTYVATRHNIGFRCVEELARRHGLSFGRGRQQAEVATGTIAGHALVLAKPQTYMNDSGLAVAPLVRFYQVEAADLIVVYDDLDVPFGSLRLRAGGSAGGQRGMRSVLTYLGRDDVPRLRVGIGRPPGRMPAERYVLAPFTAEEREQVPAIVDAAADALTMWLTDGLTAAMNRYNTWALAGAGSV